MLLANLILLCGENVPKNRVSGVSPANIHPGKTGAFLCLAKRESFSCL